MWRWIAVVSSPSFSLIFLSSAPSFALSQFGFIFRAPQQRDFCFVLSGVDEYRHISETRARLIFWCNWRKLKWYDFVYFPYDLLLLLFISDNCDSFITADNLASATSTWTYSIRYSLNQRILRTRTCHMQLDLHVIRVIDSVLKVVNLIINPFVIFIAPHSEFNLIVRWFPMCPTLFPLRHVPSETYDRVSWDYDDFLDYQRFCNVYSEIWECRFGSSIVVRSIEYLYYKYMCIKAFRIISIKWNGISRILFCGI